LFRTLFSALACRRFKSQVTFFTWLQQTQEKLFVYIFIDKFSALRLKHASCAFIFETGVFCLKMPSTYGRKKKAAAMAVCR